MRTDTLSFHLALQTLLPLYGIEASERDILQAIEAPYLFLRRADRFLAGASLFTPDGLFLYLLPRGLQLTTQQLPKKAVRAFLQAHAPALLTLPERRALIVSRCEGNRVILAAPGDQSSERVITFPTLLRKLPEECTVLTLEPCPPEQPDIISLMCESIRTLAAYRRELAEKLSLTVTRQDMQALHPLFRPLMVDFPLVAHLYSDTDLALLLLDLTHTYRHLFIIGEQEIHLADYLPQKSIDRATLWLQELILDRLYELGAPDSTLEPLHAYLRL